MIGIALALIGLVGGSVTWFIVEIHRAPTADQLGITDALEDHDLHRINVRRKFVTPVI